MESIFDFRSIRQIMDRKEQKAEFEEKNPKPPEWYSLSCISLELGSLSDRLAPGMYGGYEAPESDPA